MKFLEYTVKTSYFIMGVINIIIERRIQMRFDKGYCLNIKDVNYLNYNKGLSNIWNKNSSNNILGLNNETLEYRKKAINLARNSIVLLKNSNGLLPLNKEEVRTVAIIGKDANVGSYDKKENNKIRSLYEVSPLLGIKIKMGPNTEVIWNKGYSEDLSYNEKLLSEAVSIAKEADIAIFIEGLKDNKYQDSENKNLHISGYRNDLTYYKEKLIEEVSKVNKNTIVVIPEKSEIHVGNLFNKVRAVIQTWYSGAEFGAALSEVLIGEINPSYKLPVAWPKETAQFPFGYGLSYTKFNYSNLNIGMSKSDGKLKVNIKFKLTNIGNINGTEICQVYITNNDGLKKGIVEKLIGFRKVYLEPNETKEIELNLDRELFVLDSLDKEDISILIGSSSVDIRLKG